MRALAIMAALLAGTVEAGPYDGLYRPDSESGASWDCKTVGMGGGAMAMRDYTFFGVESECKLRNPVSVRGMPATLFDAGCSGEGEVWDERLLVAKSDAGITLLYADGTASALRLCP